MEEKVFNHVIQFKRKGQYYKTTYTSLKEQLSIEEKISICRTYLEALGIAFDGEIEIVL